MIIGSKYLFFAELPSTNSHAAILLKERNLSEGTVIYTSYQTAGRGQGGNTWESEKDKNLLLSVILFPSMVKPEEQFFLSMTVSLGICDFLKRYSEGISIKWPNDIYAGNDKIAGILIENSVMGNHIEHSIAGIGININQKEFLSDAPNPVSLANLTGEEIDADKCLKELATDLDNRYKYLIEKEFDIIMNHYKALMYRKDTWCRFSDSTGVFKGRIAGTGRDGRLQVEKEDGKINEYSFKEIDFIL
jgi:BirA family biotin operon repressor/biotin-[acetyl-CoA-carboxylase] ligase